MTRLLQPADWFPLSVHDGADHAAELARKRRESPLEPVGLLGDPRALWVAYRYDDVARVVADDAAFSLGVVEERYGAVLGRSLVTLAPTARRALRSALLERLRPGDPHLRGLVESVVAERVDAVAELVRPGRPVDLVPVLAGEVPARVLVRLLGLPDADWEAVAGLSAAAARLIEDPRGALRASRALRARFGERLREEPGGEDDDLVAVLRRTEVDGRPLADREVLSSLLLLAWAGTETAFPAIITCLYALLQRPEEAARVAADPSGQAALAAADESLRWEAPVQVTSRRVEVDLELAGERLRAGETVLAHLGSANRDEAVFPDPDEFDPRREERGRHLAFGHGPHRCLGWQLARLEVAASAQQLLARLPGLRLAPGSPPPEGQVLRSPRRLLVECP